MSAATRALVQRIAVASFVIAAAVPVRAMAQPVQLAVVSPVASDMDRSSEASS